MKNNKWVVQKNKNGKFYCSLKIEGKPGSCAYSTWYYEPFETKDKAEKWIREINFGILKFNTNSMTRTKY